MMRPTIARIRSLILMLGGGLLLAICGYLIMGRLHHRLTVSDIPARLGVNITQQANHVIYTQSRAGHTLFRIDAAKVVQIKAGNAVLSDARIDLYSSDGSQVDQIEGHQFEYDPKAGIARAVGPVEITLMKPGVAPAIAPNATPAHALGARHEGSKLAAAAEAAERGNIHVKTSGLIFDQGSGIASTRERVEFSLTQGVGSAVGATFDSQQGKMVLGSAVELHLHRGAEAVELHATHAEFERGSMACRLQSVRAQMNQSEATAGTALVVFRPDGSAQRLDATDGFTMTNKGANRITAPRGTMEFDEKNHPSRGQMEGGVVMDSESAGRDSESAGRTLHGVSPRAEFTFGSDGALRRAHLERGVDFVSSEMRNSETRNATSGPQRELRHWQSPVADLEFRTSRNRARRTDLRTASSTKTNPHTGNSILNPHAANSTTKRLELASIHGTGGVVVTSESQQHGNNAHTVSSRLSAIDMVGLFGAGGGLKSLIGTGRGMIEETTLTGTHQTASGDRLEVVFDDVAKGKQQTNTKPLDRLATDANPSSMSRPSSMDRPSGIEHATLSGHVTLSQIAAPNGKTGSAPAPLHASAGRAEYVGVGEWLHLTLSPQVDNGGLRMTAERIDLSRASGNAFAHGAVKATWQDPNGSSGAGAAHGPPTKGSSGFTDGLGGQGPTHVVSDEAELHQSTDEALFRGQARVWQGTNSISGPLIILNRRLQTLLAQDVAHSRGNVKDSPVHVVFLGGDEEKSKKKMERTAAGARADSPQLIRLRGAQLKYSAADRKAWISGGTGGVVTTETASGTVISDEVEMALRRADSTTASESSSRIDRLVARGHVKLSSAERRGTGEQVTYTGSDGVFTMIGTDAIPPKLTDPDRGSVTGETLIFDSRDDSVSVVGGKRKTTTETTAPR